MLRTMGRDWPVGAARRAGTADPHGVGRCRSRSFPYRATGAPFVERNRRREATTVAGVGHVPMYDDPPTVAAQRSSTSPAGSTTSRQAERPKAAQEHAT
jgi:hypothetical protein